MTQPTTDRGVKAPCPNPGCQGENVKLRLGDMTFECPDCDGEWNLDVLRAMLGAWGKVLAWCEQAPLEEKP